MSEALPDHADPFRLALGAAEFADTLLLRIFPRLRELLLSEEGEVRAQIRFQTDRIGQPHLAAVITANPVLRCQRCLQPYSAELYAEVDQILVTTDEAADRIEEQGAEALVVVDAQAFSLHQWLEDELILALPVVAHHPQAACALELEYRAPVREAGESGVQQTEERRFPFAGLGALWNVAEDSEPSD